MTLSPGDVLAGRYRIEQELGAGGMGTVFLVREDPGNARRVLKQLRADHPELLAAFRAEFSLLASVTDPNLVRVHDFGSSPVRGELVSYYVAEWIDGQTLGEFARTAPLGALLGALRDALQGLGALHELGVRHGDLTPANVLVDRSGRATVIDLGCARPFAHRSEVVAGTPGYIAPEVLAAGGGDGRADLFAFGVTLAKVLELARLPKAPALAELVAQLVSEDPARRPSSVGAVLERLGGPARRRPAFRGISRTLVGRDNEIQRFLEFVRAIARRARGPRVLWVTGGPGAGTTRLVRELVARAELSVPVYRAHAAEPRAARWLLTRATGTADAGSGARAVIDAAKRLASREEPQLLVLEDADRLDEEERELLLVLARSLPDDGSTALLVSSREPLTDERAQTITVGALDLAALRAWTEHSMSEGALQALLERTAGNARAIERELERLLGARQDAAIEELPAPDTGGTIAADAAESAALALLVALDGELDPERWGLSTDSFREALTSGIVVRERSLFRLRDRELLSSLERSLPPPALAHAHSRVARALAEDAVSARDSATEAEIVRHLALGGKVAAAEQRLASAQDLFAGNPRPLAHRASALIARTRSDDALSRVARLALLANEPRPALSAVAKLLRLRPSAEVEAEARLLAADALIRLGRGERAERALGRVLSSDAAELRVRALECVARARMQRGDHAGAKAAAERALALDSPEDPRSLVLETLGVAHSYLGNAAEAEACFSRVYAQLDAAERPRDACRLLGHRAIAAFRAGRSSDAARDHERALELAERGGLDDLVAVCALNLGTALQQLGNWGGALTSYERGLSVARALGRENTELTLRYNLATLRAEIGDFHRALQELEQWERRAKKGLHEQFAPAIAMLRAEIALAQGDPRRTEIELERAERAFQERKLERELLEVELCRAELELETGHYARAEGRSSSAQERASALGAADLVLRASFVRARSETARGDAAGEDRLKTALRLASESAQRLWEAHIVTELSRLPNANASEWADRARRAWDRMAANLPEEERQLFWADRRRGDLALVTYLARSRGTGNEAEALRRLLSLSRRLNSSLSLTTVLDYAVEAATELTSAERGFLLLRDGTADARVAASRPRDSGNEPPSHSIVRRVLETEEAVLATDAQSDERFEVAGSVHALRLKSVLCVPIGTPASLLGVLYVDSRLQRGRFGAADRSLLLALADQLAVALTNARLHAELEQRAHELEEQKRMIERLSRGKDRELERLREQLEAQQRALGLRYDYSSIVGRGPRMRSLLEKLDRVIDSPASVLIQGESGTGKELVARALHVNGARAQGPFVGVNCAALPEPLLESELFGHVKGAFTGADRDKKGLLLAANGGTLFLDEVGEMPLVTQTKLLRVLQEREVRPVGGQRSLPLDVRLVCATHRDLLVEVADGRFREDLYYRLAVVVLEVPALRERTEDLPALCRAVLERIARDTGRPAPELSPEALRALGAHPFPGNVRELENVLTRAVVLASGPKIGLADLDLGNRPKAPSRSASRAAYEREERERILAALTTCRWNVSIVGRQLGIPRNTLYRKLKKYGLDRGQPET